LQKLLRKIKQGARLFHPVLKALAGQNSLFESRLPRARNFPRNKKR
jgi:hypothetical protein